MARKSILPHQPGVWFVLYQNVSKGGVMKPTFVKKNTAGGTAGIEWEAGEVQPVDPYLADELVKLAPGDYEIVQQGEVTPPAPAHNAPGFEVPRLVADGEGIHVEQPHSTVIEGEVEGSTSENEAAAATFEKKPAGRPKKKAESSSEE